MLYEVITIEFHSLSVDVDTTEDVADKYPGAPAPVVREGKPCSKVNVGETVISPGKLATTFQL